MIKAQDFVSECVRRGFTFFTGTPCSYLKPLINYLIDEQNIKFISAVNEGEAVAMASGNWLAGQKTMVLFQNAGLGKAVNPITSLSQTFKIPFLGIVTLRGDPNGAKDEPQHQLMGEITSKLLDLMKIPWEYFPSEKDKIVPILNMAEKMMINERVPFFLIMKKGSVLNYPLSSKKPIDINWKNSAQIKSSLIDRPLSENPTRSEALKSIIKILPPQTAYIVSTGKAGRELFELRDQKNNFYMVGSMGRALAISIGLSLSQSNKQFCVIDGDGALLMNMGSMATAGRIRSPNLIHILLDNGVHDSTGGQRTGSEHICLASVALAAGYENIIETNELKEFEHFLEITKNSKKLSFARFLITPGSPANLGRPTISPIDVALRFRNFMTGVSDNEPRDH